MVDGGMIVCEWLMEGVKFYHSNDIRGEFMLSGIVIAFFSTYFGCCYYSKIISWERQGKIDRTLPYAIG